MYSTNSSTENLPVSFGVIEMKYNEKKTTRTARIMLPEIMIAFSYLSPLLFIIPKH